MGLNLGLRLLGGRRLSANLLLGGSPLSSTTARLLGSLSDGLGGLTDGLGSLLRTGRTSGLRLNLLCLRVLCRSGACGRIARTRSLALPDYPLHFGDFATLCLQAINNAARAAINDDNPDHQQDDGKGQNHQA